MHLLWMPLPQMQRPDSISRLELLALECLRSLWSLHNALSPIRSSQWLERSPDLRSTLPPLRSEESPAPRQGHFEI